ncbi:MAG: PKD domain-containing protein, partial [Pseudomonadota bacterium]|nr:PKD domain-containing protein [Pseudomonadota bacterium]
MKMIFSNRRIAPLAALTLVASLGTLLSTPLVHAASSYVGTWNDIYPGSSSADNADCQLCHAASTQNLNPYGEAICSSNAGNISNRIQAVESVNSDTDPTGSDNLTEISASTQPGWTPGNVNPTFNRGNCNATGNVEAPPTFIAGDMDPVAGNQPPTADANGPYNGTVNVPLTLDGSASSDPDGTIVYSWDFGDGNTGTGASPTHVYITDGTFNVSLTVTDDAGDTGTDATTATIGLGNQPPVADANGPYSGTVGVAVSFDGTGSNDPDGTIASYSWDFGDGSTGNGPSPTHIYATASMFNVTLTVTDDTGASDSAGTSAEIVEQPVNQPPVADANGPYSGTAGVAITFDGSGSNDPDGSIVNYSWDFGDGSTGRGRGCPAVAGIIHHRQGHGKVPVSAVGVGWRYATAGTAV